MENPTHALFHFLPDSGWQLIGTYRSKAAASEAVAVASQVMPTEILCLVRCGPHGEALEPPPVEVVREAVLLQQRRLLERCLEVQP